MTESSLGIADIFVAIFATSSVQIPIIGTLLALVASKNIAFAPQVISKLEKLLLTKLGEKDITSSKLILRSIAVLASSECFQIEEQTGLVGIFDNLLSFVDSSILSSDVIHLSPAAKVALYLVATSIPWAISGLVKSSSGQDLLVRLKAVLSHVSKHYLSPYDVSSSYKPIFYAYYELPEPIEGSESTSKHNHVLSVGPEGVCCWDMFWSTLSVALELINSFEIGVSTLPTCMSAYWLELPAPILNDHKIGFSTSWETSFVETFRTAFSSSLVPEEQLWSQPRFHLFDSSVVSVSDVKCFQLSVVEKHILAEYYYDILHFFEPIMNEDGTRIGTLETLVDQLYHVDKVITRNYLQGSSPLHSEYLVCEVLLQLFAVIPVNIHINVTVSRVLLELSKKDTRYAVAIALGALLIYQLMPSLDHSVLREYSTWLSFHLANTKLSWPYWDHWIEDLRPDQVEAEGMSDEVVASLDASSASGLFCRLIIDRLSRIFVPEVVRSSLPVSLHSWVPSSDQIHLNLSWTYIHEVDVSDGFLTSFEAVSINIMEQVKQEDPDVIERFLDERNEALDSSHQVSIYTSDHLFILIQITAARPLLGELS